MSAITANSLLVSYDLSGEDMDMASTVTQLQRAYRELGQVLRRPEAFGLGQSVPKPLADRLEATLGLLDQEIDQAEESAPDQDLAVELSQDADRPTLAQ